MAVAVKNIPFKTGTRYHFEFDAVVEQVEASVNTSWGRYIKLGNGQFLYPDKLDGIIVSEVEPEYEHGKAYESETGEVFIYNKNNDQFPWVGLSSSGVEKSYFLDYPKRPLHKLG